MSKKKKKQIIQFINEELGFMKPLEKFIYIDDKKTNYKILSNGVVVSINYNKTKVSKVLKDQITKSGYHRILLHVDGKIYPKQIHRLVAEAFIPNPENKPQVNHKDGNKDNNNVENLEWVTAKENTEHAIKNGLFSFQTSERSVNKKISVKLDLYYIHPDEYSTIIKRGL